MMQMKKSLFVTALLFIFCMKALAIPNVPLTDEKIINQARTVLLGVDDMVMRLNSGVCYVRGKSVDGSESHVDNVFIAFDYSSSHYRYENNKSQNVLLTPEFLYELSWPHQISRTALHRYAASDYDLSTPQETLFIDVRNLFQTVPAGPHNPFDYQNSNFHNGVKDFAITEYLETGSGIAKISIIEPYLEVGQLITEYHVNVIQGYTVTHIDSYVEPFSSPGEKILPHQHDISWKRINKTWVPVSYRFDNLADNPLDRSTIEWKIDWDNVNKTVKSALFELDDFLSSEERAIPLFSHELGTIIDLGNINEPVMSSTQMTSHKLTIPIFRITAVFFGTVFIIAGLWRRFLLAKRGIQESFSERNANIP